MNQVIESTVVPSGLASPSPRRLAVFDNVPPWAIVHAARDNRSAPLICEGEVVVVEGDGCTGTIPEDGGLYLIEHVIAPHSARYGRERRVREIVQVCRAADGSWWARPYSRQSGSRTIVCSDGPYTDEIMLAEKILGPVVGIYRPEASKPLGIVRD